MFRSSPHRGKSSVSTELFWHVPGILDDNFTLPPWFFKTKLCCIWIEHHSQVMVVPRGWKHVLYTCVSWIYSPVPSKNEVNHIFALWTFWHFSAIFDYKTAFFCACQTELIKNENMITIIVFLWHWCSSFLALKKVNFMWLTSFLLETGDMYSPFLQWFG